MCEAVQGVGRRVRCRLGRVADGLEPEPASLPVVRELVDGASATVRRSLGRGGFDYDTPWPESDVLADALFGDGDAPCWWGDPCAGVGRLLVSVLERAGRDSVLVASDWHARVRACDLDPEAIGVADVATLVVADGLASRAFVAGDVGGAAAVARAALGRRQFDTGDFLEVWAGFAHGGYVITNPPFESIRALHRRLGRASVLALRARFETCVGSFDSAVPVMTRVLELGTGGRIAAVVPASWLSAGYAEGVRGLMARRGTWRRLCGRSRPFRASVTTLLVATGDSRRDSLLDEQTLDWERARRDPPRGAVLLGDVVRITSGTPGFDAARVSGALVEGRVSEGWPFVASGTIGRFGLREGPVRLLGRRVSEPWLPFSAVSAPARRRVYDGAKVVVPGVARRPRAAWVGGGCALSVGVLALEPLDGTEATGRLVEAVVNSSWAAEWIAANDPGATLSGGYRRLSGPALRALPLPAPEHPATRAFGERLRGEELASASARAIGGSLDEAVFALYRAVEG